MTDRLRILQSMGEAVGTHINLPTTKQDASIQHSHRHTQLCLHATCNILCPAHPASHQPTTHSLTLSLSHSLAHLLTLSLTHSLTHSLTNDTIFYILSLCTHILKYSSHHFCYPHTTLSPCLSFSLTHTFAHTFMHTYTRVLQPQNKHIHTLTQDQTDLHSRETSRWSSQSSCASSTHLPHHSAPPPTLVVELSFPGETSAYCDFGAPCEHCEGCGQCDGCIGAGLVKTMMSLSGSGDVSR